MDSYAANGLLASPHTLIAFHNPTANAWGASFLRHLQAELGEPPTETPSYVEEVCRKAQSLFNARQADLPDAPSHTVLGVCALMVASCETLRAAGTDAEHACAQVERCLVATYQDFIQNICKPLLMKAGRSPRTLARMNFQAWSEQMERPADAPPGRLPVAGTGYQRCFSALGEPALAQIIERADRAWIEAVAAYGGAPLGGRRDTRTGDRRTSPNAGFEPFHFAPTPPRRRPVQADVVLELQIHLPADRRGRADGGERRHNWSGVDRRQSSRRQDDLQPRS